MALKGSNPFRPPIPGQRGFKAPNGVSQTGFSGQKVQKTPPAADALPFSAASDSFVAVAPQRQDRPHVSARIAGDPLEQQLTDLSPAAASAAEPAIEVTMAQRIADWLAEEAYNSR